MKSVSVRIKESAPAIGKDSQIPSSCQNFGSTNIRGRKNKICPDVAVMKVNTAFPIA